MHTWFTVRGSLQGNLCVDLTPLFKHIDTMGHHRYTRDALSRRNNQHTADVNFKITVVNDTRSKLYHINTHCYLCVREATINYFFAQAMWKWFSNVYLALKLVWLGYKYVVYFAIKLVWLGYKICQVNIGSGYGLVSSSNKPWHGPMLTKTLVAIWSHLLGPTKLRYWLKFDYHLILGVQWVISV